ELPRAAGAAFEAIAARGEPGWSTEAASRAADLRRRYDEDFQQHKQLEEAAAEMIRGGAPMSLAAAERAGSFARSALHVAIAATADPARLAALAGMAEAFGVAPELGRIRGSDLARRAPIAKQLAEAAAGTPKPALLRAIRARARAAGIEDIVRAVALLISDDDITEDDLGELKALSAGGPWWRLVAVEREVFYLTYRTQRYVEADLAARDVLGTCRADTRDHDASWCPQILRTLAASNSEIGRIDRAYELAAEARRIARAAHDRGEEGYALNVTGQIAAARVVGWDPSPVAEAYLYESALRTNNCAAKLYQLDFGARAALDYHRFAEAERLLRAADQLDEHECADKGVRYNAEEVRLRLIEHGATERVHELERRTRRIEERWGKDLNPEHRLYDDYLRARARLAVDGSPNRVAALRDVIAKAQRLRGERYPRTIRAHGHGALAEQAARRGAPEEALAEVAERLGVRLEPGCTVGINHDDRITVVVRGANDRAAAEVLEVPVGQRLLAPADLLSRPMRERLVGCARVDVLATGPYLGAARLLGPELRWAYRSSPRRATSPQRLERQVVVTDVEPPAELGLPPLQRMQLAQARVLSRAMATPDGVLEAISDAELVVINAHGITDANEPSAASLVLSPDAKGSYWLTADRVRQARLAGAPVVILAACHAGRVQVTTEPWSLASSFLAAGARAVIAPTTEISDDTANGVFESIVKRMQSGRSPEQAVAEEREASGARAPWL
ncbi:MAG TPA: CHAT domain-containing protein, partial [Kofleriaceae bacterium]|nr:CHAT domain-containing protein [Kofleriaceae bacterium]